MRGDEGIYWKDMNLPARRGIPGIISPPQILEEDFTSTNGKELYPEGPGYQALVIYQEAMPIASAKKILELAKAGQKIIFVNGVTEQIRPMGICATHRKAASKTPFVMESDEELAEIIRGDQGFAQCAGDGCTGRHHKDAAGAGCGAEAAFADDSRNILTCMRQTESETNLFVYNMLYTQGETGNGYAEDSRRQRPYEADCWNGRSREISGKTADGVTEVTLTLNPGEGDYADSRSGRKRPENCRRTACTAKRFPLKKWSLTVEDWNEGEKEGDHRGQRARHCNERSLLRDEEDEDRRRRCGDGSLERYPVSGTGGFRCGVLFHYGRTSRGLVERGRRSASIASTNGCTAAVYVNGEKAGVYNINRRTMEIGDLLHGGYNEIRVEVSSTLNNRLLARGYYDTSLQNSLILMAGASNGNAGAEEAAESGDVMDALEGIRRRRISHGCGDEYFLHRAGLRHDRKCGYQNLQEKLMKKRKGAHTNEQ